MKFSSSFLLSLPSLCSLVLSQKLTGTVASVPVEYTYNLNSLQFNRNPKNVASWLNTTTISNASTTALLRNAAEANFVAYSNEFYDIFGHNPTLEILAERDNYAFAHDSALWLWDKNEIWFSGSLDLSNHTHINVLDLNNRQVRRLQTSNPVLNPSAGCYFKGVAYYASDPEVPFQTSIQAISLPLLDVKSVLDSYFGLRFSSIDDVTWIQKGANSYMYFSADDLRSINKPLFPDSAEARTGRAQLPNAVWMFDPQRQILKPVISRSQIKLPAFVKTNRQATQLYVNDFSIASFNISIPGFGPGEEDWGNPVVWSYTIADDGTLHDPQLFDIAGDGAADGFHLDDAGRVWTAETDGIYVKAEDGRLLGVVNAAPLLGSGNPILSVVDFALAGDELIVLAQKKIWGIKLAQKVVDPKNWRRCLSYQRSVSSTWFHPLSCL